MCLLIWTVFSGERCGPLASCFCYLTVHVFCKIFKKYTSNARGIRLVSVLFWLLFDTLISLRAKTNRCLHHDRRVKNSSWSEVSRCLEKDEINIAYILNREYTQVVQIHLPQKVKRENWALFPLLIKFCVCVYARLGWAIAFIHMYTTNFIYYLSST